MALLDLYVLRFEQDAQAINLRNRIVAAVFVAAHDVLNESSLTPNHATRLQWARNALKTGVLLHDEGERFINYVLANPTIQAAGNAATDGDVQFVVNSLIDALA